jgi:hypothetical protein
MPAGPTSRPQVSSAATSSSRLCAANLATLKVTLYLPGGTSISGLSGNLLPAFVKIASGAGRQRDGLSVDGDEGLFIRLVAEHKLHLSRTRHDVGLLDGGGLAQRKIGDRAAVMTDEPK